MLLHERRVFGLLSASRLYGLGMLTAIFLFALGEVIWIFDPLRIGDNLYWIDLLDGLVWLLLLAPLLWITASLKGIAAWPRLSPPAKLRRGLILLLSAAAIGFMLVLLLRQELHLATLITCGGCLAGAWLMALWDMAAQELARSGRSSIPWRSGGLLLVSCTLLAALFWPTPYLVTYPGLTLNMNRYVSTEGGTSKGDIMGLLVFDRPAFPVDWLYAKWFPGYEFHPIERLGMSIGAYESLVRDLKAEANAIASAVAFQAAGIGIGATAYGAKVVLVDRAGPAFGILRPGDIIIELGGEPVTSTLELRDRMRPVQAGDGITVKLIRAERELELKTSTVVHPEDETRSAFGIQVTDELKLDLPRQVAFREYFAHQGGPSHGAALALTLYNQVTPDDITGGNHVAVTGTIAADGTVGKIGGIRQKAYTAYRAGADVFFVPAGQDTEARLGASKLTIVPVATLDEIITWLAKHPKI